MIGRAIQAPRPAAAADGREPPESQCPGTSWCALGVHANHPCSHCAPRAPRSRVASRVEVGPMRAMSPVDHAWYRMDSPENLMMVHAIMWTDEPLDWDAVRSDVAEGMLERFPKFREHPVPAGLPLGRAGWEVDPELRPRPACDLPYVAGPGGPTVRSRTTSAGRLPQSLDPANTRCGRCTASTATAKGPRSSSACTTASPTASP
jgi:hypothetical protein